MRTSQSLIGDSSLILESGCKRNLCREEFPNVRSGDDCGWKLSGRKWQLKLILLLAGLFFGSFVRFKLRYIEVSRNQQRVG